MPAVMNDPSATVSAQLDSAAGKIRVSDLTIGALTLVCLTLAYLAAMVVLDHWLNLDAWVRKLAFAGFAVAFGLTAWRFLIRPLRSMVNPLFAAKLVEETIPDAKNSLVNWVDLNSQKLPDSVRNVVTAKAARQLAKADLNKAVENRALVYAGSTIAALVVALAIMFLIFKPASFFNHAGRTMNPFSSTASSRQTTIEILKPVGGNLTVVAGEPVIITVKVMGREPDMNAPDRVRLMLRHNPADPNADEVGLEPVGDREWTLTLPPHLVQNGFWYRVAGGTFVGTEEYRVIVKPRPVFTDFSVKYQYPKYLNIKDETSRDPHIEAYSGTTVTITATANRDLVEGSILTSGPAKSFPGTVAGNTLTVSFKLNFALEATSNYRLFFKAASGETNTDSPPYLLRMIRDVEPEIRFTAEPPDVASLPLNGMLTLDAVATDDFGVDTVTLRMQYRPDEKSQWVMLKPKPYREGKSFRRESDNTWPTKLEYKDSVKLDGVTTIDGKPVAVKENGTIEYWIEATDNCTEPQANVGMTKRYQVKLSAPIVEEAKKRQDAEATARKDQETRHAGEQDKRNAGESRPAQPGPQDKKQPETEPGKSPEAKGTEPGKTPEAKGNEPGKTPEAKGNEPGKTPEAKGNEPGKTPEAKGNEPGKTPEAKGNEPGKTPEAKGNEPGKTPEAKGNEPGTKGAEPGKKGTESSSGSEKSPPNHADEKLKAEKKKIEEEVGKMKNESTGGGSDKKMTPEEFERAGRELSSENPGQKKAAEEKLDNAIGKDKRQEADSLFRDRKSPDQQTREKAEKKIEDIKKDLDELQKKNKKPETAPQPSGSGEKKSDGAGDKKMTPEEFEKAGRELDSENQGQKQAAQDKLDNVIGKDKRREVEDLFRDAKSTDPKTKEQAEKKIEEMKKDLDELQKKNKKPESAPQPGSNDQKPDTKPDGKNDPGAKTPPPGKGTEEGNKGGKPQPGNQGSGSGEQKPLDSKEFDKAGQELSSENPGQKKAAEEKLDNAIGKDKRQEAEGLFRDRQSPDPKTRENAEKKIEEMKKDLDELQKKNKDKQGGTGEQKPLDPKDLSRDLNDPAKRDAAKSKLDKAAADAAKKDAEKLNEDLKSPDEATRKAAQEKLDKMKGDAKKDAGQLAEDLKSKDAATKKAAEEKLEDMKKKAGEQKPQPGDVKPEDLNQAAKDLTSDDPMKKKAAQDTLYKAVGEQARKDAEKLAEDLKSKDDATRMAAEDKVRKAAEEAGKKEADKLAEDLKSNDPAKKAAAEKKLDDIRKKAEEFAKDQRSQEIADAAKDLASDDAAKKKAAQDKLDEMVGEQARKDAEKLAEDLKSSDPEKQNAAKKKLDDFKNDMAKLPKPGPGGGAGTDKGVPLKADERFGKSAGDLRLEDLKKNRANAELLKRLGWTQEDYDRFLAGYEEMLKREEAAKTNPDGSKPPAVDRVNTGTAGKVDTRGNPAGKTEGSGPSNAAPGFTDAQKRMQEAARKAAEKK